MTYRLIPARAEHARQIVDFLSITCYWKEFVEGNALGQAYEDFMLEWIVTPRLGLTTVLVQEGREDHVCGCITAATVEQLGSMPDYTPHLHPRVMEVFGPWFKHPVTDGVVIELIAVEKSLRGQGLGSKLHQVAEDLAVREGKDCLSAFIWACFPDNLINVTRKGFMVTHAIELGAPVDIALLYVQKKPGYAAQRDYFQTAAYQATRNLLL